MKNYLAALYLLALCISAAVPAAAQDVITVDVTAVIADVSRKPIGINVNFLLDDDVNRAAAIVSLADALKKAGVKYLRYPGGEKSDAYLWSVPPYQSAVPTLARWASGDWPDNQEWPSYDRQLVEADGRTFKVSPLDFDEFMAVCQEIGCVPTIVVCYDSMYKDAQPGGVAPGRAELLETAREWVRYANVTRKYGIKYWEIGNETWLPHYNGSATAANYARDLVDFSRAMKAVDPTILIGANGESDSWWRAVLPTAAAAIDFLAVHNYPAMNWGSFSYYQNNNINLMSVVHAAQQAIKSYAPAADRNRLMIASTEVNSADWSGGWPHVNDLGHAIALFDTVGAHLLNPRVAFTQLWNTRWSGNDTASTPVLWDALDKHNELQSTGRAMAIWGQFLKDQIVSSSSTVKVRSYTTFSPSSGKLTVFLINKDSVARSTSVALRNAADRFVVDTWVFSGKDAQDVYPTWVNHGPRQAAGDDVAVTLAPVSVTVLDITPRGIVHPVPGTVEAEDFRDGGYWDATSGNSGNAYRATDVDIQATTDTGGGFNVGWISAEEWLDYEISVEQAGYYDFAARVAAPSAGRALRLLVNGADVAGSIAVPSTGAWQAWQTVTKSVYLPAGTHRATVAAITDGFNLNWIAFTASSASAHVVPGTIQAEDFNDDGYWDSTSGNAGTTYRSTDVDVQATSDSGGGFNVGWIAAGEWLEYTVRVGATGDYDIAARVASPQSGRSLAVQVDGLDITGAVAVPYTGGWQQWRTVTHARVHLAAGTHRVRIVALTGGFNLNWLSITASAGDDPAPPVVVVQAEDFLDNAFWDSTAGNAGNAYRSSDVDIQATSDVGGGYNVGWIAAGEWLEYTVQIAVAGHYDIAARVASPHTGKTYNLLVAGGDITGAVSVPNTGGYQKWQTVTRPRVYLPAGMHKLRFSSSTGGFNLNWLSLQRSP